MILVLRFAGIPVDDQQDKSTSMDLLCYGTTVGFSIIVSGDILRRLFSDIKDAIDKIEILNNVIAVILFTALGVSRVERYNSRYSQEWWIEAFEKGIEKQNYLELSDFSTGEILSS